MHLQQTKQGSRKSGGQQFYLHELAPTIKTYLRARQTVPVALKTPQGVTSPIYLAVSKYAKLDKQGQVVPGKVGHDRIQGGRVLGGLASESIGEAIRQHYQLESGNYERIYLDLELVNDILYLTPQEIEYANSDVIEPIKPTVTADDRAWYASVKGATVKRAESISPFKRSDPQGPRQRQYIEKTKIEMIESACKNDRRCYGCLGKFGWYIKKAEHDFEYMDIEHGHITKARHLGGTKDDDYPVCKICQKIQGLDPGRPVALFQAICQQVFLERGYTFVELIEKPAIAAAVSTNG
jgi:hypothetical protein